MGFKCGIVGLPNVGKSTLFNALTQTAAAQAANYPFCTIEPNVGDVAVPDPRLETLAEIAGSKEIIPTRLTFVDIAGLVRGASKGEGLGNQFLANIRECDAIAHVVRCFEDGDITHVEGKIDPISRHRDDRDRADARRSRQPGKPRRRRWRRRPRAATRRPKELARSRRRCLVAAARGPAGARGGNRRRGAQALRLARAPVVEARALCLQCRGSLGGRRQRLLGEVAERAKAEGAAAVVVSAKIESEIAVLPREEQKDYLEAVGLDEPGLNRVIRAGYALLHLITLLHRRPQGGARLDGRDKAARAPAAAGVIHTDFEKGFIRAETIAYEDYVASKGEAGAREAGRFRLEGKEYVVATATCMHFRFAN